MNLKDFANGTAAFFKLLRNGKLHELDKLMEAGKLIGEFRVTKFENDNAFASGDAYSTGDPFRNQLVNTGLIAIWDLVTGQGGTAFSNANAYLGVGDSSAAVSVSQTDLQASTNKTYTAMNGSYPNAPSNGVEQWQATWASGSGNYAWNEFAVFNGNNPPTAKMLNRALSTQGTKTSGQTWQLLYQITLS